MKSAALTLIFVFVAFGTLGFALSELATSRQENARLLEQLQAAQAANAAGQEALAAATTETELVRAELQVSQQLLVDLAEENVSLNQKVHDLEAALEAANSAGAAPGAASPSVCPDMRPDTNENWESLLQPAAALILAVSLGLVRRWSAPVRRGRRN